MGLNGNKVSYYIVPFCTIHVDYQWALIFFLIIVRVENLHPELIKQEILLRM